MDTAEPLLTVMIPVYNGEKYLASALESVLSQPLAELEALVLDDGSTDGTPQICQEFAARDSRVVISRHKNVGLGSNRNLGYPLVRGRWLVFLDHDDILSPGVLSEGLAKALSSCEEQGVGMVVTSRVRADSHLDHMIFDPIPLNGVRPSRGGCSWQIPYELATNIYRTDVVVGNNITFATTRPEMESIFRHQAAFLAGNVLFCRNAALEVRRGCDTQITRNWDQLHMRAVRIAGYASLPEWHRAHRSATSDITRAYAALSGTIVDFFVYALSHKASYDAMKNELAETGVSESALVPNPQYSNRANSLLEAYQARSTGRLFALAAVGSLRSFLGRCAQKIFRSAGSRQLSSASLAQMAEDLPATICDLLKSDQTDNGER